MAVNLINVSGIEGKTGTQLLTTSTAAVSGLGVADSATTTIIKLHTLVATNIDGSNDVDVSVKLTAWNSGSAGGTLKGWLAYTITVPSDSTLVLVSRDTAIYIPHDTKIEALASAASDCQLTYSYDEIT
jgi:hypothetical protein